MSILPKQLLNCQRSEKEEGKKRERQREREREEGDDWKLA